MQNSRDIQECLDRLLDKNEKVFIVPHNNPDMDALGASMGMSLICNKKGKENYIVINDELDKIEAVTRKVIKAVGSEYKIIKASELERLLDDKSLLLLVDVNKRNRISVTPYLDRFNDIFILDHHKIDENTIQTNNMFVDDKLSSTCEEVGRLIFLYDVDITPDQAKYLWAGIALDTNKVWNTKVMTETLSVITELSRKGASVPFDLFIEDFKHDRIVQELVNNTEFINGCSVCVEDNKVLDSADIAKAADYSLKYDIKAAFSLSHVDENTIYICARSKGLIDVDKIMKLFGGAGSEISAAAAVKGTSIDEVKSQLREILNNSPHLEESAGPVLKLTP